MEIEFTIKRRINMAVSVAIAWEKTIGRLGQ